MTSGTTISSGGTEDVFSGGATDHSQVFGKEVVSSGGSGYGDTVHTGGVLTISSGGQVAGGLTISGGYAAISGAVASGQEIRFAGTGDLTFYDLTAFHATIGGYSTGDEFDLGGFAFGAGETRSFTEAASLTSGTLTVTDGADVAKLTLLGSYVTSGLRSQQRPSRRHVCEVRLKGRGLWFDHKTAFGTPATRIVRGSSNARGRLRPSGQRRDPPIWQRRRRGSTCRVTFAHERSPTAAAARRFPSR